MNKYIDADKLIAEIEKRIREHRKSLKKDITSISEATLKGSLCAYKSIEHFIDSLQQEQPVNMIQWTGNNLKKVIDFTGKSPRFEEWFKSWEEFETYVHQHSDILKLFCEDGSHYEVPKGAWIVKTPDGYNLPSVAKYIQHPAEWSEEDEVIIREITSCLQENAKENVFYACTNWLKELPQRFVIQPKQEWSEEDKKVFNGVIDTIKDAIAECDCDDVGTKARIIYEKELKWLETRLKSLRPLPKQEKPEVDLEKAARYVYESWMGGTMDDVRRDMVELGKVLNARKE